MATLPLLRLSLPLQSHKTTPFTAPHAIKPTLPILRSQRLKPISTTTIITKATYSPIPATDRLISVASYFLPFFNGIQYGRYLFTKYPLLSLPFLPLFPLVSLYHSIPYASFISFFGFYIGVVRNTSLSRYVRFNTLQALVLDILLVLPMLVQRIVSPGQSGIALKITAWCHSGVFAFVVVCFLYGLVCSVLGKTPYLPLVAEAAGRQLE